jgi:hypothetical protein
MSFGTTDQRAFERYANHTRVTCVHCNADLIGKTQDYSFPDGRGRYAKYCCECRMHTFYDGPQSMAEPKHPALAPFVQMPKPQLPPPEPLPKYKEHKVMGLTYVVRALIVLWFMALAVVYLR